MTAGVLIPRAPVGPPAPEDGWKIWAADSFNPAYSLASMWWANRQERGGITNPNQDLPGFNANEVEVFNSSQVSLSATLGLVLTAVCINATKSSSSYRSGAICSYVPTGGGMAWKPTAGQILCFTLRRLRLPTIGGGDVGVWTSNNGAITPANNYEEIDLIEQQNWNGPAESAAYPAMAVNNWFGNNNSSTQNFNSSVNLFQNNNVPNLTPQDDGLPHDYAWVIDGTNETMSSYIDGAAYTLENASYQPTSSLGQPWPTSPLLLWQNFMVSFGIRDIGKADRNPGYVLGVGDYCSAGDFAAYANGTADLTQSTQGGMIAPGTSIAGGSNVVQKGLVWNGAQGWIRP